MWMHRRRIFLFIAVSALLHVLLVWWGSVVIVPEIQEHRVRVRSPFLPAVQRFEAHLAVLKYHATLEYLRSEATPQALAEEGDLHLQGLDIMEIPFLAETGAVDTFAVGSEGKSDRLDVGQFLSENKPITPLADPLEVDARGRHYTTAVVDGESGKLKWAYLHLPIYMGPTGVEESLLHMRRGRGLPGPVPIVGVVHYQNLGPPIGEDIARMHIEGFKDPDPLQAFYHHPERHVLSYQEMKKLPVLWANYIDVESSTAMARYLIEGGFVFAGQGKLDLIRRALDMHLGMGQVRSLQVELGHPLFHSFYDIAEYIQPTKLCPGVMPLPALELDGRIIALAQPTYEYRYPCRANIFFVNALAFALAQPSPMAGRYIARK